MISIERRVEILGVCHERGLCRSCCSEILYSTRGSDADKRFRRTAASRTLMIKWVSAGRNYKQAVNWEQVCNNHTLLLMLESTVCVIAATRKMLCQENGFLALG